MENKVSVIVPIYKVEAYLKRCLDSIVNQTYKNLEIILVDDESPDNCGEICDEYAAKDDRIIVIHKKNEGLSCARNTGLDVITGEYIAYVDSDDHLDVTMIEKMMHFVLAHDLDVIEILPDNRNNRNECDNSFIIEDPVQATKRILINTAFSVWRRIFKKEFVQDFRFIPGLIHQDVFYTMDTLKRLPKYGHLKSVLYFYNIDSISIIRSKYSLEKITVGIRATEYIINNHLAHPDITIEVDNYVTHYYTDHFYMLSRNTPIDLNRNFRKRLKTTIIKTLNLKNINFRSLLVIVLPIKIMELVSHTYIYFKSWHFKFRLNFLLKWKKKLVLLSPYIMSKTI